jgi:hypothetical protein
MARKKLAHKAVMAVERVWDFYFELFGQRQSPFGEWLKPSAWAKLAHSRASAVFRYAAGFSHATSY